LFTKSAAYYDSLYSWKDYAAEAGKLRAPVYRGVRDDLRSEDVRQER